MASLLRTAQPGGKEAEVSHHFTTELGRMRTEEMIARADRYRLATQARKNKKAEPQQTPRTSRLGIPVYRRVLAAFGLSVVMIVATAALAFARPVGPGPTSESGATTRQLRRQGPVEQYQPATSGTERSDSSDVPAIASGAIVGLLLIGGTAMVIMRRKQEPSTV
jgi:hypothetical protein